MNEQAEKLKCEVQNDFICKLVTALTIFNIHLIHYYIIIASKHLTIAYNILPQNISIYISKLHSFCSLLTTIGYGIESGIHKLLSDHFYYINIGISLSISICRLLFLIIIYRSKLTLFYIIVNIESLLTGLYKILIFVNLSKYSAIFILSKDISAISISIIQIILDLSIKKNSHLILKIESLFLMSISFIISGSCIAYGDLDIKKFQNDSFDEVSRIISNMNSNIDGLKSEISELDELVPSIVKIYQLETINKYLKIVSSTISKIEQIEPIDELENLKKFINYANQLKIKIKSYIQTRTLDTMIEPLIIKKNLISENQQNPGKKSDKKNLEALKSKLVAILKKTKETIRNIQYIERIKFDDDQTHLIDFDKLLCILTNLENLENKLEELIEKSDFEKLEKVLDGIIYIFKKINTNNLIQGMNEFEQLNKKLEEVKDINIEINMTNTIIQQIYVSKKNNLINQQIQSIEQYINNLENPIKDKISSEIRQFISLDYNKSNTIDKLTSNENKLKDKSELTIVNELNENIKKLSSEISLLKGLMIQLKKDYEIPELLQYLIPIKDNEFNISNKKKQIMDGLKNAGLKLLPTIKMKSIIDNNNAAIQNLKSLINSSEFQRQNQNNITNKKQITEKLDDINQIIIKIQENFDIEKLIKLKSELVPSKLELGILLQEIKDDKVKPVIELTKNLITNLTILQSLETKPKLNLFYDEIILIVARIIQPQIKNLIVNIPLNEKKIINLYFKYDSPVEKSKELIELEIEVDKAEREVPVGLKSLGLMVETPDPNDKLSKQLENLKHKLENHIREKSKQHLEILQYLQDAKDHLEEIFDHIGISNIIPHGQKHKQLNSIMIKLLNANQILKASKYIDNIVLTKISNIINNISLTSINLENYKMSLLKPIRNRIFLNTAIEYLDKINVQEIYDIYDTILSLKNGQILSNISGAINEIKKLEKNMLFNDLIDIKDDLKQDKLDLEKDLNYITKSKEETELIKKLNQVKNQINSTKLLSKTKPILYNQLIQYEKERLEKELHEKYNTLVQIEEKEKHQLEDLNKTKDNVINIINQRKESIINQPEKIKPMIYDIQNKINNFTMLDHLLYVLSPFMMGIGSSTITNLVYPGILPLAIMEIDNCESINLYTPLFYIIGSTIIFVIDHFIDIFREWKWYCNLGWILIIPEIIIMIFSFSSIHCNIKCSKQIATSKSRIFIMLSILLISYSLMESTSYMAISNYVVYKSKYFKNSVNVIRYYLISLSFINFLIYKLSVGYNVIRVKHNYIAPNFQPYEINNKHNFCFWFLNTLLRSTIDIFLDFKLNIRDYT